MGLLAASVTQQQMIAYKNDLEYKISLIEESKMHLAAASTELINAGTDLDPENPMVKQIEQRKERLNLLEKKLDMQLNTLRSQLKLADSNLRMASEQVDGSLKGGHYGR